MGTEVRVISFNNLQIDHLSKQQVLGCRNPGRRSLPRISLLKREETLATIFTTALLWEILPYSYVIQIKDFLAVKVGTRACWYEGVPVKIQAAPEMRSYVESCRRPARRRGARSAATLYSLARRSRSAWSGFPVCLQ